MSKLTQRLAQKIKDDLGLDVDPDTFMSHRPGKHQRAAAAWSWSIHGKGPKSLTVGSQWTATECTRKNVKLLRIENSRDFDWNVDIIPEKI